MIILQATYDVANTFWDQHFMDLTKRVRDVLTVTSFMQTAQEIAAILTLIYLAFKSYMMIIGEGRFEIMPLFRPFIIGLCIINLGTIAKIVEYPSHVVEKQLIDKFKANVETVDTHFQTKKVVSDSLWDEVIMATTTMSDSVHKAQSAFGKGVDFITHGAMSKIQVMMAWGEKMLWAKISIWIQNLIETLMVALFKGIAYLMFFVQIILLYVLLSIGPFSFAFSIAGPFRDSWVHWISRFFAVSFYKAITLIVLNLCLLIYNYGVRQEIDRIRGLLYTLNVKHDMPSFLVEASHFSANLIYVFIAVVVAIGGCISVPTISTWIIQTAGTGNSFLGTTTRALAGAGKSATRAATYPVRKLFG